MVGWLIIDAHLWLRPGGPSGEHRQKAALYNASTALTLAAGVTLAYVALYVINLVWALFIVNGTVFRSLVSHPISGTDYLTLAWLVASAATVGGALGSGLESDEAIRAAAYAKREQERRQLLDKNDQTESG